MKRSVMSKILLAVLALVMIVSMLPLSAIAAPLTYTVNFSDEKYPAFGGGDKADGDYDKYGDDDYFTVFYGAKTKYDTSNKTFEDGLSFTRRMNFQGKTEFTDEGNVLKAIQIKAEGPGTAKIWWVLGDAGRQVALFDANGEVIDKSEVDGEKNALYITELDIPAAGTYYLGNLEGSNYYFQVSVTVEPAATEKPDVPPAGDLLIAVLAVMAVSGGAVLTLNKKREN